MFINCCQLWSFSFCTIRKLSLVIVVYFAFSFKIIHNLTMLKPTWRLPAKTFLWNKNIDQWGCISGMLLISYSSFPDDARCCVLTIYYEVWREMICGFEHQENWIKCLYMYVHMHVYACVCMCATYIMYPHSFYLYLLLLPEYFMPPIMVNY